MLEFNSETINLFKYPDISCDLIVPSIKLFKWPDIFWNLMVKSISVFKLARYILGFNSEIY